MSLRLVLGLVALSLAVVAPSPFALGDEGVIHEVVMVRNAYILSPDNLTIKAGEAVKWTNSDERKHFIASIPGSGSNEDLEIFSTMEPGQTWTHTFAVPGEYPYFCFIHNQMTGKVTVVK